jgi:hypothetical protein
LRATDCLVERCGVSVDQGSGLGSQLVNAHILLMIGDLLDEVRFVVTETQVVATSTLSRRLLVFGSVHVADECEDLAHVRRYEQEGHDELLGGESRIRRLPDCSRFSRPVSLM